MAGGRRGQRTRLDLRTRGLAGFFLALAALFARRLGTDDAGHGPRDCALRGRLRGRGLRLRRGRFGGCLRGRRGRRLRGGGLRGRGLHRSGFLRRRRGLLWFLLFVRHQAFLTMTMPFLPPGTAPAMTRSERAGSERRISRFRTVTLSAPWCAAIRSPFSTRPGVVPEPTEPCRRRWSEPWDFGPRVKWCRCTGPWKPFPFETPLTCTLSPALNRSTPISCPVAKPATSSTRTSRSPCSDGRSLR